MKGRQTLSLLLVTLAFNLFSVPGIDARTQSSPGRQTDGQSVEVLKNALPDAQLATGIDGAQAWLSHPTTRYGHGVLGDRIEAEALSVRFKKDKVRVLKLPADSVFEDRYPRWADLDGDNREELFLVRSYLSEGAALVVVKIDENALTISAETPPIGTPNRWLNPVGAGDFNGDGILELAYVETPHIGGTLKIYSYADGRLVLVDQMYGFSNHSIGSRQLQLSAVMDVDGNGADEIYLPSADRRSLLKVSMINNRLAKIKIVDHPSTIATDFEIGDWDNDGDLDLKYGLSNGQRIELLFP